MVPVSELGIGFLLNRYNWQSLQFQRLDDIRPRIATNGPQQPNWRSQYASLVHAAPIWPPLRIRLVDVLIEQWRPPMVAAPWFRVFFELSRPVTPETRRAGVVPLREGMRRSARFGLYGQKRLPRHQPSALCASSAR